MFFLSVLAHKLNAIISPIELLELAIKVADVDKENLNHFSALPSPTQLEAELEILQRFTPPLALSILDSLVPSSSYTGSPGNRNESPVYDSQGCSPYARTRIALLELVTLDRRLLQENIWVIPQLITLEIFSRDFVALPSHSNPLFSVTGGTRNAHERLMIKSQRTLAYALSSLGSDLTAAWHRDLTTLLRKAKSKPANGLGLGSLADVVAGAFWASATKGAVLHARIFHGLLRGLLREGTVEASDMWLTLAQGHLDSGRYNQFASTIIRLMLYASSSTALRCDHSLCNKSQPRVPSFGPHSERNFKQAFRCAPRKSKFRRAAVVAFAQRGSSFS